MNPTLTEHENTSGGRIFWPSPQDYCEAVQTPRLSFADEELCNGAVKTSPLGLPICMSGNFASVFCFDCGSKKVAVRCFLHNIPDQHRRYSEISKFVLSDNLECTVPFEYLEKGIKVHGDWYPILKMQWVDGITLGQFVENHLENWMAVNLLAGYFKDMVIDLQKGGIAHGDLQHDNILISDDSLRLVDYDGLFVPALAGCCANELGHPNYQHPLRTKDDFAPYLDNFSGWVIYLSLRILSMHPELLKQVQGGGDCLLLRQADWQKPDQSIAFRLLEHHSDERVRNYAQVLRLFLTVPPYEIPPLNVPINQLVDAAKHVAEQRKAIHINLVQGSRLNQTDCAASVDFESSTGLPDWLDNSASNGEEHRRKGHAIEFSAPPLQTPAQANTAQNSPAQSLYAKSPLLAPSQPAGGTNLHSPFLQPSSVTPTNAPIPDYLYPEFLRIELPFDAASELQRPNGVQDLIVPQLEPGESVIWQTQEPPGRPQISKWVVGCLCLALFGLVLLSPAIFSIAIASFVLMYMCGFYGLPREEQILALITDRRLIYVTRTGATSYTFYSRCMARSVPLSAIAGIHFTEPNRLTFFAVNDFRLAYFKYASKLNITASRSDAQALLKLQPHMAVKPSRAPSHLVSNQNPSILQLGQVLNVLNQPWVQPALAFNSGGSQPAVPTVLQLANTKCPSCGRLVTKSSTICPACAYAFTGNGGKQGLNPPPLAMASAKVATHIGLMHHPSATHAPAGQSYTASGRLANAQNPHLHYPGSTAHPFKASLLPPVTSGPDPNDPSAKEETISVDELARLLGLTASSMLSHSAAGNGNGKNGASGGVSSTSSNCVSGGNGSGSSSGKTTVTNGSTPASAGSSSPQSNGGVVISTAKSPSPSAVVTLKDPNEPDKGAYITIKQAAQILGKKRAAP